MKAELNRKLHAAAGELTDKKTAHETLHMIIEQKPYYKDSVSDLSDEEGKVLLEAIEKQVRLNKLQVSNALGQPVLISASQLKYARDMIIELEWSDAYIATVLSNRYQHEDTLETMTSAKAVKLVAYLKNRLQHKKADA